MAELLASGLKQTQVAHTLGVSRATVSRARRNDRSCWRLGDVLPGLMPPFQLPLSKDLYRLCQSHRRCLTAKQAADVIQQVQVFAAKLGQENFLNSSRLKKALGTRTGNSVEAIVKASKNALAKEVVKQRPSVERLAQALQRQRFSSGSSGQTEFAFLLNLVTRPLSAWPFKFMPGCLRSRRRINSSRTCNGFSNPSGARQPGGKRSRRPHCAYRSEWDEQRRQWEAHSEAA